MHSTFFTRLGTRLAPSSFGVAPLPIHATFNLRSGCFSHLNTRQVTMPITEEVLEASVLGQAIDETSDKTIRGVLKSICAKNDEARQEAERRLLVPPTDPKEKSAPAKVLVPRYAFCVNCEKEFDVTTNGEKKCQYHPMPCEPTGEELFVDSYGEFEVDTDEMRRDFPHCFTFECCGGDLENNPDGCEFDFHQEPADNRRLKRTRAC